MKPGTIDAAVERELARIRNIYTGPGGPFGGGDGRNGGDRGDFGNWRAELSDTQEQNSDKTRVVTWITLLVVLMTFSGLIGAYVVIATNKVLEWQPFSLPIAVWVSTVLIIASSFTYHLGQMAVTRKNVAAARRYLVLTAAIGGMFIASQLLAWLALYNRGLFVSGNPYAGFFYILTAIHGLHVIGGIVALAAVLLRSWNSTECERETEYRNNLARSVGWYWHFMGGLWIVLFLLLGFWH